jgi:hypothetical protein
MEAQYTARRLPANSKKHRHAAGWGSETILAPVTRLPAGHLTFLKPALISEVIQTYDWKTR